MGDRYLITGVQLGMLEALAETNINKFKLLLMEIEDEQFVFRSTKLILDDVDELENYEIKGDKK